MKHKRLPVAWGALALMIACLLAVAVATVGTLSPDDSLHHGLGGDRAAHAVVSLQLGEVASQPIVRTTPAPDSQRHVLWPVVAAVLTGGAALAFRRGMATRGRTGAPPPGAHPARPSLRAPPVAVAPC